MHGLPYPNSHLSAEKRFALYLAQLEAAAERQREHRASRAATFDGDPITEAAAHELRQLGQLRAA